MLGDGWPVGQAWPKSLLWVPRETTPTGGQNASSHLNYKSRNLTALPCCLLNTIAQIKNCCFSPF